MNCWNLKMNLINFLHMHLCAMTILSGEKEEERHIRWQRQFDICAVNVATPFWAWSDGNPLTGKTHFSTITT